jgi:hypothetical protein
LEAAMPLAYDHRVHLARVLAWSRRNGWQHDVYPNTWRTTDGATHVRFDADKGQLVVDRMTGDPLRCKVALIPVDSVDEALRVLAALRHIPWSYAVDPVYEQEWLSQVRSPFPTADDCTRAVYRTLMDGGRHAYISTYCQHGQHDDCRLTCKCCDAPCLCSGCLHVVPEPETARCLMSYGGERHPQHHWQRDDDAWLKCLGWPLVQVDESTPDELDGPASFLDAGQAFADWVDGRITSERAAEVLSRLAQQGLIVSAAYHDEVTGGGSTDLMDDLADIFRDPQ